MPEALQLTCRLRIADTIPKLVRDFARVFNLDWIKEKAAKIFREVKVERLPGIEYKESRRAAELFLASIKTL